MLEIVAIIVFFGYLFKFDGLKWIRAILGVYGFLVILLIIIFLYLYFTGNFIL